ncbi:hypothetical protein QA601_18945, partial [Chitinispirillales bacterium ANBcel5]|uniref:hypothetical protein n=1 Tax=Cellulosispirillum alkaliphilum TaxID=3039283 RepID=UPI002A576B18|nr:hypothetical protein [Chitinispirillales bacterium ANBcel5]
MYRCKMLLLLVAAFLFYMSCRSPTNPGENVNLAAINLRLNDENSDVIEGQPVDINIEITLPNFVESIHISCEESAFDTTFVYEFEGDSWHDTITFTHIFSVSGDVELIATATLNSDPREEKTSILPLTVLSKPFYFDKDSLGSEYTILTKKPDTIGFTIIEDRSPPNSVSGLFISGQDTSDLDFSYSDLEGYIPLLIEEPGEYTLFLRASDEDDIFDYIEFELTVHNEPCFAQIPEKESVMTLSQTDTLYFESCDDDFDTFEILLLNEEDFGDEELSVISDEES